MTLLRPLIVTTVLAMAAPAMSLTVGAKLSPRFYQATAPPTVDQGWSYSAMYESSSCDDKVPVAFFAFPECSYASEMSECTTIDWNGNPYDPNNVTADPLMYAAVSCTADVDELADSLYGDQAYLRFDYYWEADCHSPVGIDFYLIDGACHAAYGFVNTEELSTISWRVFVNDNGSTTIQRFYNGDCSGVEETGRVIEQEEFTANECINGIIVSTNAKAGDGLEAGAIAGIVMGCVAAVGLFAIGYMAWRRRRQPAKYQPNLSTTEASNATADDSSHPYRSKD